MTAQDVKAAYPDLYALTRAGQVFHAMTAKTGVAPGTDIGTTAAFSLYNPIGSGVNLVVLKAEMGYVSGTIGAGFVALVANTNPQAAATTGTDVTEVNAFLGGAGSQGRALTTATLPATPTLLRPIWNLDAELASSVVGMRQLAEDLGGGIIVPPGCTVSLEAVAAAGSSPVVVFGMTWAEVSTQS